MQMSKAYDSHALVEALKQEGIEGGVETVKKSVSVLADFLRSSAQMSKDGLVGHLDDFAIPGINYFEKLALEKLDALLVKMESPSTPEAVSAPVSAPEASAEPAAAASPVPSPTAAPSTDGAPST